MKLIQVVRVRILRVYYIVLSLILATSFASALDLDTSAITQRSGETYLAVLSQRVNI